MRFPRYEKGSTGTREGFLFSVRGGETISPTRLSLWEGRHLEFLRICLFLQLREERDCSQLVFLEQKGVKSADDLLREIAQSAWLDERPVGLSQLSPS